MLLGNKSKNLENKAAFFAEKALHINKENLDVVHLVQ